MATLAGVLLSCSICQALKEASWLGSFSLIQCLRCLKGQPLWSLSLLFSCLCWCVGREATVMAPLFARDSAVSPRLVFPHRHFPPWSLPSCALGSSPCNQQQILPWVCPPIPMLNFPAAVLSRGLVCLSGICVAVSMIVLLHQFVSPSILPHIHSPFSMFASLLLPWKQVPSF